MGASDLAIADTFGWARRHLRRSGARVLEVGCGSGELARRLVDAGFEVLAIDADVESVGRARSLSVDARLARFPAFEDDAPGAKSGFDAILFTRSLHHMGSLGEVFARVLELLRRDGVVLVDDWAWNRVDRATAAWMYGLVDVGRALGLFTAPEWDSGGDFLESWMRDHEAEHLHHDDAMLAAARACLRIDDVERVPYFHRYFGRYLDDHPRGIAATEKVLAAERALIAAGAIVPIGLRFAARRR